MARTSFHEQVSQQFASHGFSCQALPYARRTGGQVMAYFLQPAAALPTSPLVVYVHGTGNDCLYPQVSLFQALVQAGYRVFSFDLDGHGAQSSTTLDLAGIRSCLGEACAFIRGHAPHGTLHLVGHSLGGALALAFAATGEGPPLHSLSLIATPLHLSLTAASTAGEILSLMSPSLGRQLNLYGLFHLLPAVARFKRQHYPIRLASQTAAAPPTRALYYVEAVAQLLDELRLADCASVLDLPTLLCYGSEDRIAPPVHGRILAKNLHHPHYFRVERETHFTSLFSPLLEKELCLWISQCDKAAQPQRQPKQG